MTARRKRPSYVVSGAKPCSRTRAKPLHGSSGEGRLRPLARLVSEVFLSESFTLTQTHSVPLPTPLLNPASCSESGEALARGRAAGPCNFSVTFLKTSASRSSVQSRRDCMSSGEWPSGCEAGRGARRAGVSGRSGCQSATVQSYGQETPHGPRRGPSPRAAGTLYLPGFPVYTFLQ